MFIGLHPGKDTARMIESSSLVFSHPGLREKGLRIALGRSRTASLLLLFDAGLRLGVVVSIVRLKRG